MNRLYEWRCQTATCRVLLMELIAGPGTQIRHKCRKCGTMNVMTAPGQRLPAPPALDPGLIRKEWGA
jgi:hypothetical protein